MNICRGFTETVGKTPLIRLNKFSDETGCEILGKAEFLNPGGSVKDRAALFMIQDGINRKLIKPGGLIVEGTAGNTGIGLTLCANSLGYRSLIIIPETQSQEKKDMLKLCGAELIENPALPFSDPNNYQHVAKRMAEDLLKTEENGVLFADQWNNLANQQAHYETTGPEIWEQTNGEIDAFICAVGTGGTIAGTSSFLKEKKSNIFIGLADPYGAAMYSYFSYGEINSTGNSITEGIGLGRVTPIIKDVKVDMAYQITDKQALEVTFDLLKSEGLCLGGSSGINVAGAIHVANKLGPGHTIVTILCDSGIRYQSKLFNPSYLKEKGLPCPDWLV